MEESKEDAALRAQLMEEIMDNIYIIAQNINEHNNNVQKL